jgi:hypothetical protein
VAGLCQGGSQLRRPRHRVIGAPIVFAAGWTLFGERLFADYVVLFVLAYIFGIAFQYFPIRAMRNIPPQTALTPLPIRADFVAEVC